MKLVFSLILTLFVVFSSSAKQKGDSLYVYAKVKLRLSPSEKAKNDIVIPYGARVKYYYTSRHKYDKGYFDTRWAKIGYDGKYGFIPDIYLSKLPMVSFDYIDCEENNLLTSYIKARYTVEENVKTEAFIGNVDGEDYHITKTFECSASPEILTLEENDYWGSTETVLQIKGIELTEAYFLMKYLLKQCSNPFNKQALRSLRIFSDSNDKPNRVAQSYNGIDDQFYIKKLSGGVIEIKMTSTVIQ